MKFHENPSSGEPSFSVRTDRHDEANSRFYQFCEGAKKTPVLPFVLCGFQSCSAVLREELGLRMFEKKVVKTIIGLNREEVEGGGNLHN